MRIACLALTLGLLTVACAPDTSMPVSNYQWERRQERIEREWQAEQAAARPAPAAMPEDPQ
jgi:hypothetical protein